MAHAGRNLPSHFADARLEPAILIAGIARSPRAMIVRLRPSGRRDTHFGTRGVTFPVLGRPGGGDPVWTSFQGVDAAAATRSWWAPAGPGPLIRSLRHGVHGQLSLTVAELL